MDSIAPLRIGLTGGIGSGKTTAAHYFKKLGASIIDADAISHQLTEKKTPAYEQIVAHFGKIILCSDDTLDRKKLRDIVFNHPSEKVWLENYLHPLIREAMQSEIKKCHTPYCICVIPLLTESKGIDFIDRVLVIDTPITQQLARAKKRDATSAKSIEKIIAVQANQSARLKIADDIITNDGDLKSLEKQVYKLHQHYLKLA
ncbi:MAG: dephospho-CoA kinase [Gammaproteobacteria bacterium CG_4_10_14_0_8_um_filter_38_16]|nr:MAG: dephospho-CoA kinase [Gammaproteobacteria bacterium CG_4_10_14_0_8_um_filter_38_16]PJA03781.1 MAG: dephospho-CoA kinase [Gammaproteobacteria bacterium CG_4_10_14_0_2_um_filter_38_22]PJB10392.1 MAG: dephospho-CoA kinase [Gammaproteobacteria bacterium CG_4_9_14_3_um_filter_38_9]